MRNINKAFIYCGAASLLAILLSVKFALPLLLAIALELGPLGVYFYVLLRARHEGLAATAIDSVYYFGFLITIFSLAASVLRVWLGGIGSDITSLVSHFGVGLLATGIALAFRLYLTAATDQLDKKDLDEAIDSYIRRVDTVVSKVELSASNFEGLANSLEERTRSVADEIFEQFQATMIDSADSFKEEIATITQSASTSIETFSATVQSVASSDHVASFNNDMRALTTGLAGFSDEMRTYAKKVGDDAQAALRQAFGESMRAHSQGLSILTAEAKVSIEELVTAAREIDFSEDATAVREQMRALSSTVNNVTKKFSTIEARLEQTIVEKSAATVTTMLEEFTSQIAEVSTWIGEKTHTQVASIFQEIATNASDGIRATSNAASKHIANDVNLLSQQIESINQSLKNTSLVNQLEDFGEATGRVRASIDSTTQKMDQVAQEVAKLASRVMEAKDVVDLHSIRQSFETITESVSALDKRMAQSLSQSELPMRIDQLASANHQLTTVLVQTNGALSPAIDNLTRFTDKIAALPEALDPQRVREKLNTLADALAQHAEWLKTQAIPEPTTLRGVEHSPSARLNASGDLNQGIKEIETEQAISK